MFSYKCWERSEPWPGASTLDLGWFVTRLDNRQPIELSFPKQGLVTQREGGGKESKSTTQALWGLGQMLPLLGDDTDFSLAPLNLVSVPRLYFFHRSLSHSYLPLWLSACLPSPTGPWRQEPSHTHHGINAPGNSLKKASYWEGIGTGPNKVCLGLNFRFHLGQLLSE